jgi:hypothetical protein
MAPRSNPVGRQSARWKKIPNRAYY